MHPDRKLWNNSTVIAASVRAAVLIGAMETPELLAERFDLTGGVWLSIVAPGQRQTARGWR
jgi:high-affinity nickel permease